MAPTVTGAARRALNWLPFASASRVADVLRTAVWLVPAVCAAGAGRTAHRLPGGVAAGRRVRARRGGDLAPERDPVGGLAGGAAGAAADDGE